MPTGGHRDLAAWQKGMELVGAVYRLTARLPERERFGLTSQLRRSVIAVPVNLAEGRRQRSDREFRRYVSIAHGSLREVEIDVLIAIGLGYVPAAAARPILDLAAETGRLLAGLHQTLTGRIGSA